MFVFQRLLQYIFTSELKYVCLCRIWFEVNITNTNYIKSYIVPHTEMFQFGKFSGFSLTKITMITVSVFNSTLQLIR